MRSPRKDLGDCDGSSRGTSDAFDPVCNVDDQTVPVPTREGRQAGRQAGGKESYVVASQENGIRTLNARNALKAVRPTSYCLL